MKVKAIEIRRNGYGADIGKLCGTIEVDNAHGEIKIRIDHEKCTRIVELLADALVETAKDTATLMIESVRAVQPVMIDAVSTTRDDDDIPF